jgi:hypothetical protein
METTDIILKIINDTLDTKNISTDTISQQLIVNRDKMVDFRNGDIKDTNLLYDCFDVLYPRGTQDIVFLRELADSLSLKQLKGIFKNRDNLREDMKHLKSYQYEELMNDVLRNIVVKTSRNQLREVKNEDNPLC